MGANTKRYKSEQTNGDQLLPIGELKKAIGVRSNTTIYGWVKVGILPKQRKIGPRRVGWLRSEIDQFIASRPAVSRDAA